MSTDIRILCPCTSAQGYELCCGGKLTSFVCVCGSMRTCVADAVDDEPFCEPAVEACSPCFSATSGCVSVHHGQQSGEPARRRAALHPQEQFIHHELPQAERLWQRDLQTPPLGPSLTPLVPASQNNRRRSRKVKGRGTMRLYWLGWVAKSCTNVWVFFFQFINNLANDPYHTTNHIITFLWEQRRLDSNFELWNSHTSHAERKHIKLC